MARETKGRGSKKRITEIQEIKKLLTRMGSVKERNAELMVHVMFAVYAALWVSTCSQIIKKLEDENQLQYVLYNFYHHPRFYLGLGTFIDLTAFLNQRMRDYCIGMISSRWEAKGANVCGAGGL